jgi:hypothetical protein
MLRGNRARIIMVGMARIIRLGLNFRLLFDLMVLVLLFPCLVLLFPCLVLRVRVVLMVMCMCLP